jgi:hypothetical protein
VSRVTRSGWIAQRSADAAATRGTRGTRDRAAESASVSARRIDDRASRQWGRCDRWRAPLGAPGGTEVIFLIFPFLLVSAIRPVNLQEGTPLQS